MLPGPFVVKFIHHKNAVLVTQFDKLAAIRIMRCANMVHAVFLDELETFLYGPRIRSSAKGAKCMMIGVTFQQHLLAIEQQSLIGSDFHRTDAEMIGCHIRHSAILSEDFHFRCIEARCFGVPQQRFSNSDFGYLGLHSPRLSVTAFCRCDLVDQLPIGIIDAHLYLCFSCPGTVGELSFDAHIFIIPCGDI